MFSDLVDHNKIQSVSRICHQLQHFVLSFFLYVSSHLNAELYGVVYVQSFNIVYLSNLSILYI